MNFCTAKDGKWEAVDEESTKKIADTTNIF